MKPVALAFKALDEKQQLHVDTMEGELAMGIMKLGEDEESEHFRGFLLGSGSIQDTISLFAQMAEHIAEQLSEEMGMPKEQILYALGGMIQDEVKPKYISKPVPKELIELLSKIGYL